MQVSHENRTQSSEVTLNLKAMTLLKYNASMEMHSDME